MAARRLPFFFHPHYRRSPYAGRTLIVRVCASMRSKRPPARTRMLKSFPTNSMSSNRGLAASGTHAPSSAWARVFSVDSQGQPPPPIALLPCAARMSGRTPAQAQATALAQAAAMPHWHAARAPGVIQAQLFLHPSSCTAVRREMALVTAECERQREKEVHHGS